MEKVSVVIKQEIQKLPSVSIQNPNQETSTSLSNDKYDLSDNMKTVLHRRGVPDEFLNAELQSKNSIDENAGYFLFGPVGTGKTYRAVAIMREMMMRKSNPYKIDSMVRGIYDAWFYPVTSLLLRIKSSFHPEATETEGDVIDRISAHDLLVLDDMGTEKITDWTLQTMRTIIDIRSRENKQTIITSNLSLDEISKVMDDRISSRIRGMCKVIAMTGKDRRA